MYTILIVDTDSHELNTISRVVSQADCGLQIVSILADSQTALQYLENHTVDILIATVRLPHLDGISLLREIRSRNLHTRCILFADREALPCVQTAIPLDIENFLLQPIDPSLLLDALLSSIQKIAQSQIGSRSSIDVPPEIGMDSHLTLPVDHDFEVHPIEQEYPQCFAYLNTQNMRYSTIVSYVIAYIEKNYAQDLSLKILSHKLNINAAYLGRLFKSETGQVFTAYLNSIRITHAKRMLATTDHTLENVSRLCGYTNISYFYNMFKKLTEQTPTQYRKSEKSKK